MAQVGVRGGDAEGLATIQGQSRGGGAEEDGGENRGAARSAGVHFLELQKGHLSLWRAGRHSDGTHKVSVTQDLLHHHQQGTRGGGGCDRVRFVPSVIRTTRVISLSSVLIFCPGQNCLA